MAANYTHIGGPENSLGLHYGVFPSRAPCLSTTCDAKIAVWPVESAKSG
jgi:hypothetical protein